MSTATAVAESWLKPHQAARILGTTRDTLLKHAAHWGIRVRSFPRERYQLRVVHEGDTLRFKAELEAAEAIRINETTRLEA